MSYDFYKEIRNILNCAKFDADDFKIINNGAAVNIEYIYSNEGWYFKFDIPSTKEVINDTNSVSFGLSKATKLAYVFKGRLAPGKYANVESFKYYDFDYIKMEIKKWLEYLHEELIKTPENINAKSNENNQEFEKYKEQFETIEKIIDEQFDDKEMFSQEDKEQFSKKLDEVKNEFSEQLKKVISEQKTLKAELDKVNEDFSKLKDSLNYMSKRNWGKKFISKTKEFFKDANKRKVAFTLLKGTNMFLKECNIDIPLLDEGIETINKISGDE